MKANLLHNERCLVSNPAALTLNPNTDTLSPKPRTLNPKHSTSKWPRFPRSTFFPLFFLGSLTKAKT